MRANKARDAKPEMFVRRLAHVRGLRYRLDTRPIPELNRRADLVFKGAKVAVFTDGCFWHGCPLHHTCQVQHQVLVREGQFDPRA